MKKIILFLFVFSILTASKGQRNWVISNNGNNTNSGTKLYPLETVQAGIDSCKSGDTVILTEGTYQENLVYPSGKKIIIGSEFLLDKKESHIAKTIVDGSNYFGNNPLFYTSSSEFHVIGITITGAPKQVFATWNTNSSSIRKCNITECGNSSVWGVVFTQGNTYIDSCTFSKNFGRYIVAFGRGSSSSPLQRIERCTFTENGGTSYINSPDYAEIFVEDRVIIRSCLFYKNNQTCIATGGNGGVDSVLIINNTITNNLSYGIAFHNWGGGSLNIVYNNIIQNNNQYNLYFNNSGYSIVLLRKNIIFPYLRKVPYYPSRFNFKITDFGQDTVGAIVLNKDYSLPNNSRAIGYGYSSKFTIRDIYGITQPNPTGSNPDVGAIENSAGFPSPTMVTAEGGNKKITITYTQSTVTGLKKYKLYRSTKPISDTATIGLIVDTLSATNFSYKDSGLTNLTKYYYRIKGVLTSGLESNFSNELSAKPNTPPAAPDSILVQNGARLNYITWAASKSKPVKYRVYRGLTTSNLHIIKDTTSKLSFLDTGLTAWKKYYYAIRCIDTVGVPSTYSAIKVGVPNNIWWVDTAGNDNNLGSNAFPFATIENAIKKAQSSSHDTIYIKGGLHKANINPNGKNIVIEGYMGSQYTIIEPKNTNDNLIYLSNGEPRTMIIKGLTFQNALFTLKSSPDKQYCNANIQNCVFTKCGSPNSGSPVIWTHYGGLRFDNCIFYKNLGHTMYFDYKDTSGGMGNFFVNCSFIDNYRYAGGGQNGPGRIYFSNCILWESQKDTLQELSSQANSYIFQNCIIKDNYFSKTTSNTNIDPKFVNVTNGDFRLQNNSEAIGAGQSKFTQYGYRKIDALNTDFVNTKRPSPAGTNPDLGAFENSAGFPCPNLINAEGGNKKITVTYSKSNVTGLKKYKLYRSTKTISDTATIGLIVDTLSATNLSYKDSGLTNLTKYYYRIKGVLTSGLESNFSNELSARPNTPPVAPDSISVFNGPHRVALTWPKSKTSPVVYRLFRLSSNKTERVFSTSNSNAFEDTTVEDGLIYQYKVCAVDTVGVSSTYTKPKKGRSYRLFFVSKKGKDTAGYGYESKPMKTIQYAIDKSRNGDTILVEKGVYKENVIFKGKEIILTSRYVLTGNKQFVDSTIIDGNTAGCVVRILNGEGNGTEVTGLVIQNGYALQGAGFYVSAKKLKINNVIVRNNLAAGDIDGGGGIFWVNSLQIANCVFYNNKGRKGGAIALVGGDSAWFVNNEFYDNNGWESGSSILFAGGQSQKVFINNCLIHDEDGANAFWCQSTVFINNTTIVNNTPNNSGPAIYMSSGTMNFNNCIIRNPSGTEFASLVSSTPGSIKLTNCNIRGGYTGTGNFDEDPGFIKNSFKLSNSSASIGKGNNNNLVKFDKDGLVRPQPTGSNPDLGAFENSAGFPCPLITKVSGGNKKVVLSWTQNTYTGLNKFKIYRSTKPISDTATIGVIVDTLKSTTLTYKDSGLTNLTKYYYRIKSINSSNVESLMSNQVEVKPNTPPYAPDSLFLEKGPRTIEVKWSKSTSNSVTKYALYRKTLGNSILLSDTFQNRRFLDTGLVVGQNYEYSVYSIDSVGVFSLSSISKSAYASKVWYVSLTGSNSNLGSRSKPLLTIDYTMNRAVKGDTIVLLDGTYKERINFTNRIFHLASEYVIDKDERHIANTRLNGFWTSSTLIYDNNIQSSYAYRSIIGLTVDSTKGSALYMGRVNLDRVIFKGIRNSNIANIWNGVLKKCQFLNSCSWTSNVNPLMMWDSSSVEDCIFDGLVFHDRILHVVLPIRQEVSFKRNKFINNIPMTSWNRMVWVEGNGKMTFANNLIIDKSYNQAYGFHWSGSATTDTVYVLNNTFIGGRIALWINSNGIGNFIVENNLFSPYSTGPYNGLANTFSRFLYLDGNGTGTVWMRFRNNHFDTSSGFALKLIPNINYIDTTGSKNNWGSKIDFIDPSTNNYALKSNSRDIGSGTIIPKNLIGSFDILGKSRIQPTGTNTDLGAFENSAGFPCPTLVTAEGGNKKITVTYSQFAVTGLKKYKLYRSTKPISDTATIGLIVDTLSATNLSYKDSGLTNLTKYYYRIKGVLTSGLESGFSNELSAKPNTPPAAPDSILVQNGARLNYITWAASKSKPVKYRVYRGLTTSNLQIIKDSTSKLSFLDTGLTAWEKYYYAIRCIDTVGVPSAYSVIKSGVPNNIWWVDTAGNDNNIGASWSPLKNIETGLAIAKSNFHDTVFVNSGLYYCNMNFNGKNIVLLSKNGPKKTILEPRSIYSPVIKFENNEPATCQIGGFMVRNANDSRCVSVNGAIKAFVRNMIFTASGKNMDGIVTNSYDGMTYENCLFVDNPGVIVNACYKDTNNNTGVIFNHCVFYNNADFSRECSGAGPGRIQFYNSIIWNNNKGILNGDYWMQYCSTDDTSYSKKSSNNKIEPKFTDPKNFDYSLLNSSELIGKASGNITKWGSRKLINASLDFNNKPRPNPAGTNPDLGAFENSAGFPCPTLINAEGGNKKITVTYSKSNVTGLKKYKLYRSTKTISDTATIGLIVDTLSATNLSFKDSGLNNLTKYYYRIKGVLTSGLESNFSNELSAIPNTPPATPDSILVQNGAHFNYITWNASKSKPVKYRVYRGLSTNNLQVIKDTTSKSSFLDTGLTAWKKYYYAIRCIDTVGVPSAYSVIKTGVPNNIWWVDTAGKSNSLGAKWNPVKSPNDIMLSAVDGDTIVLNKGIYYDEIKIGKAITLASLWIFNKSEQLNIDNTILDGSKISGYSYPTPFVRTIAGWNKKYQIVGFTFTNCSYGAIVATANYSGSTISNNKFINNYSNGQWLIYLQGNQIVDSCIFENNEANGLVYMAPISKTYGLPTVSRCFFTKNGADYSTSSSYYNGCIYVGRSCGIVRNCILVENKFITPIYVGANNYSSMDTVYINSNSIVNNKQNGIHISNNFNSSYSTVMIRNNIIDGNINNITFMPNSSQYCFVNFYNNFIYRPYNPGFLIYNNITGFNSAFKVNWVNNDTINRDHGVDLLNSNSVFNPANYGRFIGFGSTGKYLSKVDFYGKSSPSPINSNPDVGAIESKYSFASPYIINLEPDNKKITITYSQSTVTGLKKYKLYRSTKPISDTATIGLIVDTLSATNLSYKDSGLTNLTKYYYRIKGVLTSGLESGFSNELSAKPNTPPAAPDSILVQNGARLNYITWAASKSKPVKYRVYRGLSTSNLKIIKDTTSKLSFLDTGLTAWKKYYYAIRCIDTVGVPSAYSVIKTGVPNNIWWVDTAGKDNFIGSISLPLKSIGKAISRAISKTDTIYVTKGTYFENINFSGKSILISSLYQLNKDTSLITKTIINGSNKGNVVDVNQRETAKSVLQGFSITNGYAGLYIDNSSALKINDLKFYNNKAYYAIGSAIIVAGYCNVDANNILVENHDGNGALIYVTSWGSNSNFNNLTIRNNTNLKNAVFVSDLGTTTLKNALIYNNGDVPCIGIMNNKNGFNIINSTLISNKAAPVRVLYNNSTSTKINIVNSILQSNYSGKQIEINNHNPATYIGVQNSIISGGKNSIELLSNTTLDTGKTNTIFDLNPNFINPNSFNYLLSNNSPLIGMGVNSCILNNDTIFAPKFDIINKPRPNPAGSNPDIGAFENINAFPCPFVDSARTFGDSAIIYYTVNTLNKGTKILLNFYDSLNTMVLKDSVTINTAKSAYVYKTTKLSIGKRYGINLSQNFAGIGISNLVRFNMLSVPNLVSPANNIFRQAVNLNLVWKKTKTAQFARVQLSKFANFSTVISDKTQVKDTLILTGLSLNTTYYWRVYSKDSFGRSFYSTSFKFQTLPQTAKLDSIATRPKVAKLFWKITDTTNINKFYIYRDSSIANSTLIDSVSSTIRTYSDSTIKEGKRYFYKIKLVNKQYVLSDFSNTKAANILVPPSFVSPTNLSNSLVLNQLLKWEKPIQAQFSDIQVAYNDSNFKTTILSKHQTFDSVFLSSAAVNRTYYWRLRSTDSLGYGNWSKTNKFQTLVPKPNILSINSVDKTSTLSWNVSDTFNIAKYYIYRDTLINASVLIDSVSKQYTSYTDNKVSRNNKYYYRVKAVNNERVLSVFSNERVISVLDYPVLISPKNNSVSIIRSPKIVWRKSKYATKVKYEVSLDSAFTSPLNSTYTTLDSIQLNNLKYSNYYYWRVRCEDSLSIGSWSKIAKFQTLVQTPVITKLNSSYKKTYLTWTINDTNNLKGFYILRDTINNPTKIIDSLQSWKRNYIDTPLFTATRYYYSIIAYNKQFIKGIQSVTRGVNLLEHPILSTPLNSSSQISVNTSLTWQNSKFTQNYKIQVSKDKLFSSIVRDVTVSNSPNSLSGLLKNTNYYWRIKSLDSVGSSNWSDTFKFQTEIQIPNILGITTSHKQAKVSWNLSDTTNLNNILGFYIYRDTFQSPTTLIDSVYLPTKQYTDLTVELGNLYYYRIKTINKQFIESEYSNERRAAILNYPTLITPTDTLKKSELSRVFNWSKEKYATKYQIQLAYEDSFKTPIIDQTLILDSIQLALNRFNYNYYWRVRSKDSIGLSKWSNAWYFQTKLFKPSIDTLIAANKKINIYWLKSDTQNIKEYRIYRSDNTLNPALVNRVTSIKGKNSYSYLDSGLVNFKRYYYWISAVNNQFVESELSSIKDAFTFNIKPNVSKIKDTIITNVGRNTRFKVVFSQEKAFDKDGKIDSTLWYIDGVKVKVDTFLAYKFHQGTTKVMAVVIDNDLASDTTTFNVSLMAFQKQFRAGITSGITMYNENSIYVADTSLNSFNYGEVVKLDTNGTIDFNLLVTQRIRNTPTLDFQGNLFITNGPLVNSFSYTGAPLCNEINLGAISQVTPTFDSVLNRLYLGVSNRKFFAIDLDNNCRMKWDFTSDAPISAPAVISAGRKLIFTDLSGKLYGFDVTYSYLPKTGSAPTWKYATGDSIYLAPAIDTSERIIVGTANGKLLKLNLDTINKVNVVWSTKVGKKITTSPVLDAYGNIFVCCSDGRIVKIKSSNGDTINSFNTGASIISTPSISDQSLIYVANTKGELFCLDSALILQWKYNGKDPITSHLVHYNGATYVGTQNGKFMSFYDLNLDASVGSIKSNITKRKLNKITKPIWGTFQGNVRRTGVQDAIFREVFIDKLEDKDVKLFPNPSNEKFNIESIIGMSHITVTNLTGATVLDINLNNQSRLTISSLDLSNGVYFVRIFTNKGNLVKKMIIQK